MKTCARFFFCLSILLIFSACDSTPNLSSIPVVADSSQNGSTFSSALTGDSRFNNSTVAGIAIQSGGKVLVAGTTSEDNESTDSTMALLRFNADGSLDTSFGKGGFFELTFSQGNAVGSSLALDSSGNILVAGQVYTLNPQNPLSTQSQQMAIARFAQDGSPDPSFNGSGSLTYAPAGYLYSLASAIALEPNGDIVVAGFVFAQGGSDWQPAIARFKPNGTLDSSFAQQGLAVVDLPPQLAYVEVNYNLGLSITSDGSFVVSGSSNTSEGVVGWVAQLNSDETLDTSFGDLGVMVSKASFLSFNLNASGDILVGGSGASGGFLQELNSGGQNMFASSNSEQPVFYALAENSQGNIFAAGPSGSQSGGSVLTVFSSQGQVIGEASGPTGFVPFSLAVDQSGNVWGAGTTAGPNQSEGIGTMVVVPFQIQPSNN